MHITPTLLVEWTAANVRGDSCERLWLNKKRCSVDAGFRRQERSKIPWVTVSMLSLLELKTASCAVSWLFAPSHCNLCMYRIFSQNKIKLLYEAGLNRV